MTNFLDTIAEGIAAVIPPKDTPVQADPVETVTLKPLVTGVSDDTGDVSIAEDLIRFTLPTFNSLQTAGLGIGQINGGGSSVLHFLPRKPEKGIVVDFPKPIFGIWIDPNWTTPGANIGIGNGPTKTSYRVLGRGEGLRFKNGITKLTFYNADGLDKVFPETPNANPYPWGYLGFLIALSPEAEYTNALVNNGTCNVSKLINSFPIPQTIPADGFGNLSISLGLVSTLRLREIGLNFQFIDLTGGRAINGAAITVTPWFLTSFPTNVILGWRSAGDDLDFGPKFANAWVSGLPISFSSTAKGLFATDPLLNAGYRERLEIPNDALAVVFTSIVPVVQDGNVTGNAIGIAIEVYGYE